ncbi:hypothetical protein [Mesorhizobium sp. Cs1321R2N1]|uniref:hypothetical protein n=1 Tax=Mesorhizobium sp. Cs1321R2N1 TaxID=3015174 RepID=UPI00301DB5C0
MSFHPSPEMLDAVNEWRQRRPDERVRLALVPLLRQRFHIGPAEAVEVIRQSHAGGANADAS